MKITDLNILHMSTPTGAHTNWLFVRIETDAGLYGLGEASLHLDMCIPNAFMQEVFLNFLPRYNEVLTRPIEIVDGHCTPSDGPGWGVDLREDVLAKYPLVPFAPVESEPYREFF